MDPLDGPPLSPSSPWSEVSDESSVDYWPWDDDDRVTTMFLPEFTANNPSQSHTGHHRESDTGVNNHFDLRFHSPLGASEHLQLDSALDPLDAAWQFQQDPLASPCSSPYSPGSSRHPWPEDYVASFHSMGSMFLAAADPLPRKDKHNHVHMHSRTQLHQVSRKVVRMAKTLTLHNTECQGPPDNGNSQPKGWFKKRKAFHQRRTQHLKKTVAHHVGLVAQPIGALETPVATEEETAVTTGLTASVMRRVHDVDHKKQRRARERARLATIKVQHQQSWEQEEPGLASPPRWHDDYDPSWRMESPH